MLVLKEMQNKLIFNSNISKTSENFYLLSSNTKLQKNKQKSFFDQSARWTVEGATVQHLVTYRQGYIHSNHYPQCCDKNMFTLPDDDTK